MSPCVGGGVLMRNVSRGEIVGILAKPLSVKWAAQVKGVREVTLLGSADADFWHERLRYENIYPAMVDGKAQLLLSSTSARYLGLRFRELSIAVAVSRTNGGVFEGYFLVHAYNSRRFFAFVERALFGTPYYHATIETDDRLPARFLARKKRDILAAQMARSAESRTPLHCQDECWEGPIFLPALKSSSKLFFARLAGRTTTFSFDSGDLLTLSWSSGEVVVRALIDSQFKPEKWSIRNDARHSKSKTVARSAVLT